MESRDFHHVRTMQGNRDGQVSDGPVRATGATPSSMDEEDLELPRRSLERVRDASRGVH